MSNTFTSATNQKVGNQENMFFNYTSVFNGSCSQKLFDEPIITSVEIVNLPETSSSSDKFTLIKVTTKKGIYYYKSNFEHLLGPIHQDIVLSEPDGLFILDVDSIGTILRVFFVGDNADYSLSATELSSGHIFKKIYVRNAPSEGNTNECIIANHSLLNTFVYTNHVLYGFSYKQHSFIRISNNENAREFLFCDGKMFYPGYKPKSSIIAVVGFAENNVPVSFALYDKETMEVSLSESITVNSTESVVDRSRMPAEYFITQYICQGMSTDQIVVVNPSYENILFCTKIPAKCELKHMIRYDEEKIGTPVYQVTFDRNRFTNFYTDGSICGYPG